MCIKVSHGSMRRVVAVIIILIILIVWIAAVIEGRESVRITVPAGPCVILWVVSVAFLVPVFVFLPAILAGSCTEGLAGCISGPVSTSMDGK